jgi:hypothetical protein
MYARTYKDFAHHFYIFRHAKVHFSVDGNMKCRVCQATFSTGPDRLAHESLNHPDFVRERHALPTAEYDAGVGGSGDGSSGSAGGGGDAAADVVADEDRRSAGVAYGRPKHKSVCDQCQSEFPTKKAMVSVFLDIEKLYC